MTELTSREIRRANARLRARQHAKQASMIALSGMLAAYGTLWRSQRAYAVNVGTSCGSVTDFTSLNVAIANFNSAVDNCDTITLPASTITVDQETSGATPIVFPASASVLHVVGAGHLSSIINGSQRRILDVAMGAADQLFVSGVTLEGARVTQGRYHDGAALRVAASGAGTEVHISDVTMIDNVSDAGGAVWSNAEALQIDTSHFERNKAFGDGGAVAGSGETLSITDTVFNGNIAQGNYGGGAIDDAWDHGTISASQFDQNSAAVQGGNGGRHGGAISVRPYLTGLHISETGFWSNWTDLSNLWASGGAIHAQSPLTIDQDSGFERNTSYAGAAISSTSSVSISETSFVDNGLDQYDGVRTYYGGALLLRGSNATIADSVFDGNHAYSNGGAIDSSVNVALSISGTSFLNNEAYGSDGGDYYGHGGAIFAGDSFEAIGLANEGSLTVTRSLMDGNYAWSTAERSSPTFRPP